MTRADAATLLTVDAERIDGTVSSITDKAIELEAGGKRSVIALDRVHRIEFQAVEPVRDSAATVEVRAADGCRLFGRLEKADGTLAVASPAVDRAIALDAKGVLGVRFIRPEGQGLAADKFEQELAAPDKQADTVFVSSDKGIVPFRVVVSKVAPDKTFFKYDGEERSVDTERVAAIVFANAPEERAAGAGSGIELRLAEGSALRASSASLKGGVLAFKNMEAPEGRAWLVPAEKVISVEFLSGNVVYLSDLKPAAVEEVPFFNAVWPHAIGRSVGGNPITLDGRTYARGIGCHTRTLLRYDLRGRYRKFAAVAGIDDEARPQGSVQFVVEIDGKTACSVHLTGRDKAAPVTVDVSGAKTLTLIADFAEEASVGDHADWADARVMK